VEGDLDILERPASVAKSVNPILTVCVFYKEESGGRGVVVEEDVLVGDSFILKSRRRVLQELLAGQS
jgi:hypothetical protein